MTRIEQRSARAFIEQVGSVQRALDVLQQVRKGKLTVEEIAKQRVMAASAWASTQICAPVRMPDLLAAYERFLQDKDPHLPGNEPPTLETAPGLRKAVRKKITQLKPKSKRLANR